MIVLANCNEFSYFIYLIKTNDCWESQCIFQNVLIWVCCNKTCISAGSVQKGWRQTHLCIFPIKKVILDEYVMQKTNSYFSEIVIWILRYISIRVALHCRGKNFSYNIIVLKILYHTLKGLVPFIISTIYLKWVGTC